MCFCFRKYRGCCGLRGVTVPGIRMFPLLTCFQPTTFHLKHRASGQYTLLDGGILWVHSSSIATFHLIFMMILITASHQSKGWGLVRKKVSLCLQSYTSKFHQNKSLVSNICLIVYIQPSGNSPLWEQQSSSDSRFAKLWPCPPTISSPPACLTRLASGRKGAARSLSLPGICLLFIYTCMCVVRLIWTRQ